MSNLENGIGCGWCGAYLAMPYCPGDTLYYCPGCEHFSLVDRESGKVIRLRNMHDPRVAP